MAAQYSGSGCKPLNASSNAPGPMLGCTAERQGEAIIISFRSGAGALALALTMTAHGGCKIAQLAQWPVRQAHNRPLIEGKINGQPVTVLIDTGATGTFVWESAATSLGLPLGGVPGVRVFGAGGEARILATTVKDLEIGAYKATEVRLIAVRDRTPANPQPYDPSTVALVLGEEFFSSFSTEFDLEHGFVRLLRPEGCKPDQVAYWATSYSLAELDTGAPVSSIELGIAERVGVKRITGPSASVGEAHGISGKKFEEWLGLADTVSVGDETIRNVRVRVAPMFAPDTVQETGTHIAKSAGDLPEMLLGYDFLLAHRMLVLPKERVAVFTYNGRPPFQYVAPETQQAPQSTKAD